jgi:flagellar basal-body rod modification protein FlgD
MAIDTSAVSKGPAYTAATANPNGALGKDAFMKLLVAELKQQDPMDPMKAREMVGQLSELTTVEKLVGIDEKLSALANLSAASSGIQNAGLIGRRVEADVSTMNLSGTGGGADYELSGNAETVKVKVRDGEGNIVQTLDLGAQKLGPQTFTWDGTTDKGARAPNGNYTFEVEAKAANGLSVATSTRVSGLVTEVSYERGAPEVIVGGKRIPLGDVTSIAQ